MTTPNTVSPSDNEDADPIPNVRQPAFALDRILAEQPELYINLVGQPTIVLAETTQSASPDRPQSRIWPLRSDRVKAWIAEFTWNESGIVLAEREIDRIVTVLVGKAWHDQRNDVELTEAMDDDPLLEAIMIFMHEHAIFDKNATALIASLDQVARAAGIDTKDRLWPKGASQLSQRIGKLKPFLQRAGITAELGRRTGGHRYIKLTRHKQNDGTVAEPPPSPSVDNSHHPIDIHRHGDGDGDSRKKLFELLRTLNQETNHEGH